MFVAGADGYRGGWVLFRVDVPSLSTSVESVALPSILSQRPIELECLTIDIPIGLLDGPRACDLAARKLLGRPRGSSVFPAPCRAATRMAGYADACEINKQRSGGKLSHQAWGIVPKIKQVDEVITPAHQLWAFEVHPEVCFWAMNNCGPMIWSKKVKEGRRDRLNLLRREFPRIDQHLAIRPPGVAVDDLLDAAAAAWTALRKREGRAQQVSATEFDALGLDAAIWY